MLRPFLFALAVVLCFASLTFADTVEIQPSYQGIVLKITEGTINKSVADDLGVSPRGTIIRRVASFPIPDLTNKTVTGLSLRYSVTGNTPTAVADRSWIVGRYGNLAQGDPAADSPANSFPAAAVVTTIYLTTTDLRAVGTYERPLAAQATADFLAAASVGHFAIAVNQDSEVPGAGLASFENVVLIVTFQPTVAAPPVSVPPVSVPPVSVPPVSVPPVSVPPVSVPPTPDPADASTGTVDVPPAIPAAPSAPVIQPIACAPVPQSFHPQLHWQPSAGAGVSGYRLYVGQAPRQYGAPFDLGNPIPGADGTINLTAIGVSLDAGLSNYVALTAYGPGGESVYSNEIQTAVCGASVPAPKLCAAVPDQCPALPSYKWACVALTGTRGYSAVCGDIISGSMLETAP